MGMIASRVGSKCDYFVKILPEASQTLGTVLFSVLLCLVVSGNQVCVTTAGLCIASWWVIVWCAGVDVWLPHAPNGALGGGGGGGGSCACVE
jgi:hypothetical protein